MPELDKIVHLASLLVNEKLPAKGSFFMFIRSDIKGHLPGGR